MKKILFFSFILFSFLINQSKAQNLILNPSFEEHYIGSNPFATQLIFNDSFAPITGYNVVKNWINLSGSMDGYWTHDYLNIPMNFHSDYIYPHTDSTIVGGFEFFHGSGGGHSREIMEGKLAIPLIAGHSYQFGIWVQLFDTIYPNEVDIGKIVGINSFSAYFSNSFMPFVDYSGNNFPIQNYNPQVQIWQMVTDTQHWVLLQDTFIAAGGEQYVCIGNFKTDAQLQWQMVDSIRNLPTAAYYYYDDVSLIDITPNGVEEAEQKYSINIYPNPAQDEVSISYNDIPEGSTLQLINSVGIIVDEIKLNGRSNSQVISLDKYSSGVYLCQLVNNKIVIKQSKLNIVKQ